MMLDQDGNPNNGIQISAAVTAAAASWAPVDFDTTDLPTTLGSLDSASQCRRWRIARIARCRHGADALRTGFYCTYAGNYSGTFATDLTPRTYGEFKRPSSLTTYADHGLCQRHPGGVRSADDDGVSRLLDATFEVD